MARFFRLLKPVHHCKLWHLKQGEITPALKDLTAHQLENFSEGVWEEVFKCRGNCGNYVTSNALCKECLSKIDIDDIDMGQPVKTIIEELKNLREITGKEWNSFKKILLSIEKNGQKRATILQFLGEVNSEK